MSFENVETGSSSKQHVIDSNQPKPTQKKASGRFKIKKTISTFRRLLKKTPKNATDIEDNIHEGLLFDNEISYNEVVIEEREREIQEIQSQIATINAIYKDLDVVVREQRTMNYDIDAYARAHGGRSQLTKAAKCQRSNSFLICLLLIIFGIAILILVVVLTIRKSNKFSGRLLSEFAFGNMMSAFQSKK